MLFEQSGELAELEFEVFRGAGILDDVIRMGPKELFRVLGAHAKTGLLFRDAVPFHDAFQPHVLRRHDGHDEGAAFVEAGLEELGRVEDDALIAIEKCAVDLLVDEAEDLRVCDPVQEFRLLGGGEGPLGEQCPVQRTVLRQDVFAEDGGQFLQDGGALLGDEPGDLIRFDDLIAEVPESVRDGGLAGTGLAGEV